MLGPAEGAEEAEELKEVEQRGEQLAQIQKNCLFENLICAKYEYFRKKKCQTAFFASR